MLSDFNLVVSTYRDFESHCEAELWFNLMTLGDDTPIIANPSIPGLLLVKTHIDPRHVIAFLNSIIRDKDPAYIQYIAKIYPIDCVISAEIPLIQQSAIELVRTHPLCQNPLTKYRISIRKRQTTLHTEEIISAIADKLNFTVDLKNYDWMIQVEIINQYCGLAIIKDQDIFRPNAEKETILVDENQNLE
jgi:tRNA(Ser,Leu) C12 N-acetylase TAN1